MCRHGSTLHLAAVTSIEAKIEEQLMGVGELHSFLPILPTHTQDKLC